MGQHWSHLTSTKRIQLDAFIRAGMKPTDIAKELGVHHTTIYLQNHSGIVGLAGFLRI